MAEHLTWYHKEHFSPHPSAAWSEGRFKKRGLEDRLFLAQSLLADKHLQQPQVSVHICPLQPAGKPPKAGARPVPWVPPQRDSPESCPTTESQDVRG